MSSNQALCSPDMEDYTWFPTPNGEFRIQKTRFGLFTSYNREGGGLVTGPTYDSVMMMTPWHLHWAVNGYTAPVGQEQTTYDGTVGGKL